MKEKEKSWREHWGKEETLFSVFLTSLVAHHSPLFSLHETPCYCCTVGSVSNFTTMWRRYRRRFIALPPLLTNFTFPPNASLTDSNKLSQRCWILTSTPIPPPTTTTRRRSPSRKWRAPEASIPPLSMLPTPMTPAPTATPSPTTSPSSTTTPLPLPPENPLSAPSSYFRRPTREPRRHGWTSRRRWISTVPPRSRGSPRGSRWWRRAAVDRGRGARSIAASLSIAGLEDGNRTFG